MISSPLLQVIHAEGFGTDFLCALSECCVVFVAYAFVDSTDLIQMEKYKHDLITLLSELPTRTNLLSPCRVNFTPFHNNQIEQGKH